MLVTIELITNTLIVETAAVPEWLALLGKAEAVNDSGYGKDRKLTITPLRFQIESVPSEEAIIRPLEVGTDPA